MTEETLLVNPFENLPFNTLRAYVMGKTLTGCEIYIPVAAQESKFMNFKKRQLQKYLNAQILNQPVDEPPPLRTA